LQFGPRLDTVIFFIVQEGRLRSSLSRVKHTLLRPRGFRSHAYPLTSGNCGRRTMPSILFRGDQGLLCCSRIRDISGGSYSGLVTWSSMRLSPYPFQIVKSYSGARNCKRKRHLHRTQWEYSLIGGGYSQLNCEVRTYAPDVRLYNDINMLYEF